jgi:SAM-dependent methyltransferase
MEPTLLTDPILRAYDDLAPFYDLYTARYDHEHWLNRIETMALEHGLRGKRLLDVGCGTGKSFVPMLRRGYQVVACDLSERMVEAARHATGSQGAEIVVADMRALPRLGEFDLVTCLDDALNYLLSDEELERTFDGIARNLRRDGLFVFDLNTLGTFRRYFTRDVVTEIDDAVFCWRGDGDPEPAARCTTRARIEIFARETDGWRRTTTTHVQRHHPPDLVRRALESAGFDLILVHGQLDARRIDSHADDDYHVKLLHMARRR